MPAREDTINVAFGEVLGDLRPTGWTVLAEHQRALRDTNARPDILIEDASDWPIVIEAERESHTSAESDAIARLGEIVHVSGRPIESAIALVYPPEVRDKVGGKALRTALRETQNLEYALYTLSASRTEERTPAWGWLRGSVRDLAMLARRASIPAIRVDRLVDAFEDGVSSAAGAFGRHHPQHTGSHVGPDVAKVLGQSDDQGGQTRRMAMTVLINALIFHESLAQSAFMVDEGHRRVAPVREFFTPSSGFDQQRIVEEWSSILQVNYWPIFATAGEILDLMPIATSDALLYPLWDSAQKLIRGGVTRSHDLTGVIFQRLIADRKFLATFYTRPASAALLAGLAISADRAPGGADWADGETVASLQIGDFACCTGTLLSAAYQRLSMLHELHGGDPKALHAPMMKNGLVGLDVLNIAVHLTAAMLAGLHPEVAFEGECLLTMPFGRWGDRSRDVAIGSLDLLAEHVQPDLIDYAAATTAGGRRPEDVRDLIHRVGHNAFDLVIMNPPFTRSTGQEGTKKGVGNPAFAAFGVPKDVQKRMTGKLRWARGGSPLAKGNAGFAAEFVDLGMRKLNAQGTLALVLPLSAVSGVDWEPVRAALAAKFDRVTVVTIAAPEPEQQSFSADTGMAECLIIAQQVSSGEAAPSSQGLFVCLNEPPTTPAMGALIAESIVNADFDHIARLEVSESGSTPLYVGAEHVGRMITSALPAEGVWPVVGILDTRLAQCAYSLSHGSLQLPGPPAAVEFAIPVVPFKEIAGRRAPYHADIYWRNAEGEPRGPFDLVKPPQNPEPDYPMLWGHDTKAERKLEVLPDSEGVIKYWPRNQDAINEKATTIWSTATRLHYNRDLGFNAQSIIVAVTEVKCIGGASWPSIILDDLTHECAVCLWCNSTLGLLMHWWVTNKTQSGRGRTSVTAMPNIPTLDTRALSEDQKISAEKALAA